MLRSWSCTRTNARVDVPDGNAAGRALDAILDNGLGAMRSTVPRIFTPRDGFSLDRLRVPAGGG